MMNNSLPDLDRMAAYLAEQPDVIVAYHMDSSAAVYVKSDTDSVAANLLTPTEIPESAAVRQQEITDALVEIAGIDVQVINLNEVSYRQAFQFIKDGNRLYERDKSERIDFEVMTLSLHYDFDYQQQLSRELR